MISNNRVHGQSTLNVTNPFNHEEHHNRSTIATKHQYIAIICASIVGLLCLVALIIFVYFRRNRNMECEQKNLDLEEEQYDRVITYSSHSTGEVDNNDDKNKLDDIIIKFTSIENINDHDKNITHCKKSVAVPGTADEKDDFLSHILPDNQYDAVMVEGDIKEEYLENIQILEGLNVDEMCFLVLYTADKLEIKTDKKILKNLLQNEIKLDGSLFVKMNAKEFGKELTTIGIKVGKILRLYREIRENLNKNEINQILKETLFQTTTKQFWFILQTVIEKLQNENGLKSVNDLIKLESYIINNGINGDNFKRQTRSDFSKSFKNVQISHGDAAKIYKSLNQLKLSEIDSYLREYDTLNANKLTFDPLNVIDEYKIDVNKRKFNRFTTKVIMTQKEIEINDNDDQSSTYHSKNPSDNDNIGDELLNPIEEGEIGSYSFGIQWFYWKKYANSKYFVPAIYKDLKHEITNNKICNISIVDWNSSIKKVSNALSSNFGKNLKCNQSMLATYYNIDKNSFISDQHIMSLILYCNYDNLQCEYKKTFRQLNKAESLYSIKNRNKEFALWSKYMRECIELFGTKMRDTPNIIFYHGIISKLVFPTTIAQFNGPTSLTTSLPVAVGFSGVDGIILQLEMYSLDVTYFDVSWISDYQSENESIICGGFGCYKISNIMLLGLNHDYHHYLRGINIILSLISDRFNPENNIQLQSQVVDCIQLLTDINNFNPIPNRQIPEYPLKLWNCIRYNWNREIIISIYRLNDDNYYSSIKSIFYINNEYIDVNLCGLIFINCPKLKICGKYGNDGPKLCDKLFQNIFNLLERQQIDIKDINNNNLNQIVLESPNEIQLSCKNAIKNWKNKFEQINFRMDYEICNNVGLSSIFITKTDNITFGNKTTNDIDDINMNNDNNNDDDDDDDDDMYIMDDNNKDVDKGSSEYNECIICMDKPPEYICVPCGHYALCQNCKDLINGKCPLCQTKCSVMKVFQ